MYGKDSIQIIDGKKKDMGEGNIPEILSDALGVNFDPNIGHDYICLLYTSPSPRDATLSRMP